MADDEDDEVKQFIESLPDSVQECVISLQSLDKEVEALRKQFRAELRELERKYQALQAPIFARRRNIVVGEEDGSGIPDFWLGAMLNSLRIAPSITEKDQPILRNLTNIAVATLPQEEGTGFRLEFSFKPNEFFSDEKLIKTYHMADTHEDPLLEKCTGTNINWASGKDVTVVTKKKKQKNKKGGGTKIVTKLEKCESFFNFFDPPKIPEPDDPVEDDHQLMRKKAILELDYEIGVCLRDKIVPHAIKYFTGEAQDDDIDDEEFDSDGVADEDYDSN